MPLSDVEGQPRAIEALYRALRSGRLHHAYLFTGPDGVGKRLCACALTEALLCDVPLADGDACGDCSACRRVQDGNHPDLHILGRLAKSDGTMERFIRIHQVRELQKAISYKSYEGGRRVVLVFEPERMNASTANALLKTLEEPGAGTHFVLVTAVPHRLLPTVVSRCQRVTFAPLSAAIVTRHLMEGAQVDEAEAILLASLAEGSIGRGLSLMDSPVLAERKALLARADKVDGLHHVKDLVDLAEDLAKHKEDLPMVFHLLRTWYRDLLLVQGRLRSVPLVHADLRDTLAARAETLTFEEIVTRIDLVNETERMIMERNAQARLSLETMLLRLAGGRRRQGAR